MFEEPEGGAEEVEEVEELERAPGLEGRVYVATFPKGKEARYIFETLSLALAEANLIFSPSGITLRSLDPSKIALISLEIPSTSLEEYNVEEEVKVGLIFSTLKNIVKRIKAGDRVEIGVDLDRNKFILTMYPKKGKESGVYRRYMIPIVNVFEEEVPEARLEFDARIQIDADVITDVISMADEISDSVILKATEDSFVVRAEGDAGREVLVEFPSTHEAIVDFRVERHASARYGTELLLDFLRKMKQVSKVVLLEFSDRRPLNITFEFATGKVSMLLAPRVD